MALGVVPGGKLAHLFAKSGLGSFIGKIGASAWSSAKHYAGKAGSALGKGARGLVDRAGQFLRKSCGCFESGTVVWTLRGQVPIEQVTADDFVFAQDESTGELTIRKVLQTFVRRGAPIVAVTITTAAGGQETFRTTEEHPFWVPAIGWVEAGGLTRGDAVEVAGGCATVELVRFTPELETVYNFEVEGVHTYFVGANGVLVHNNICHKHHTLPKFLGGNDVQQLVRMPDYLHRLFHSELSRELTAAGIRRGSRKWSKHFEDYPEHLQQAHDILMDKSRQFDSRYLGQPGGYVTSLEAQLMIELGL